jgi:hypothetical protein
MTVALCPCANSLGRSDVDARLLRECIGGQHKRERADDRV